MTARTFNELFEPPIHLSLEQEGQNYIVCDGDTVYLRSPDLELAKRFMVAMQAKRQAVIDMDSYHWFRALGQHSVRVGALPERDPCGVAQRPGSQATSADVLRKSTGLEPRRTEAAGQAPPAGLVEAQRVDGSRSESASNVYRLRPAENLDETA